ncbi:unnamed protein product [Symbiodinium sp. CCMP2456]|nr:unnamed protein product [Symbiodinium sp. CCMP2456]
MGPWRGRRGRFISWILLGVLSACCILTRAGEPLRSPWLDAVCDMDLLEDCLTDSPSLCHKAARLIRRVHNLDGGHHFVEPSEVRNLCLDFLAFQEGPARPGQHITRCSRAMLAMAVLYDVVSDELNSTCSTASVHKQFPILDSFEQRVAELKQDRQHKTWWKAAYSKHTQLGSGGEFQRKGAKLLRLLANHTARCKALGHKCAVYNAWEPEECFSHDDLVQSWSPSCQDAMQIPRRPPKLRQKATDWLGLVQDCAEGLESERPQTQPEMTRMLECLGLPWGPVAGEDYFETLCLLQAVRTATSTSTFVVVEAGASVGYWAPKAAKAFRRRFPDTGACHLVLIDSIVPASSAAANLQRNGIYDLCNITFFQSRATASLLDRLIDFFGTVDLLHVDIQEAELELVQRSVRLPPLGCTVRLLD